MDQQRHTSVSNPRRPQHDPQKVQDQQTQQQRRKPQAASDCRSARHDLYIKGSSFEANSSGHDEDEDEEEEEITLLEACMDCDDDALYEIIRNGVTREQVNDRDKSGRTGLSHACANGFMPILELLVTLEDLDPNLADNDGNTPLIYASQAGHDDVVNYLLQNVRHVRTDQCNKMGFTALMKAAIQGRTRCAKLLLFAGASPNRRDYGRGLCPEEWARFCGCHSCANSIAKYVRSKKYFFKKTFILSKDKWSSEPDILNCSKRTGASGSGGGAGSGSSGGTSEKAGSWIQRHLSLKRKKPRRQTRDAPNKISDTLTSTDFAGDTNGSLASSNKFGSAPILLINSYEEDFDTFNSPAKNFRRPSCLDNVVPVSIGHRRRDQIPSGEDQNEIGDRNSSKNSSKSLFKSTSTAPTELSTLAETEVDSIQHHRPSGDKAQPPPKITVGDANENQLKSATSTRFSDVAVPTSSIATIGQPQATFLSGKAMAVSQTDVPHHGRRRSSSSSTGGKSPTPPPSPTS